MIKIALIDSGIDCTNNYLMSHVMGGISLELDKEGNIIESDEIQDKNGHGTSCCSFMLHKFENIQVYVIKVLNKNLVTHSKILIRALEYLKDKDIQIINLSLSTSNKFYASYLEKICFELYQKGKIIIAAYANNGSLSYPALLPKVVGMNAIFFKNDINYWYHNKKNAAVADVSPILVPTLDSNYILGGGTSKATALFTSIVAKKWSQNSLFTNEQVLEEIARNAQRNNWRKSELTLSSYPYAKGIPDPRLNNDELQTLQEVILDKCPNSTKREVLSEPLNKLQIDCRDIYDLLCKIEIQYNVKLSKNFMKLHSIYSYNNLSYTIGDAIYGVE